MRSGRFRGALRSRRTRERNLVHAKRLSLSKYTMHQISDCHFARLLPMNGATLPIDHRSRSSTNLSCAFWAHFVPRRGQAG